MSAPKTFLLIAFIIGILAASVYLIIYDILFATLRIVHIIGPDDDTLTKNAIAKGAYANTNTNNTDTATVVNIRALTIAKTDLALPSDFAMTIDQYEDIAKLQETNKTDDIYVKYPRLLPYKASFDTFLVSKNPPRVYVANIDTDPEVKRRYRLSRTRIRF
jgi:hypothetical protein